MAIDPGLIQRASAGTGLPPSVVREQINAESGGNPRAVSPTGAQGEFQFMPGTFKSQGTGGNPFNPNDEVRAYNKLMSTLLHQYHGNVRNALAAYNAGPGNLGAGLGYADKILAAAGLGGPGAQPNVQPGRTATFQIPGMAFRTPGVPGQTYQTSIGGGVNLQALADAVLRKEASVPINTSGKVTAGRNTLGDYVSALRSGKYNAATTASSESIPGVAGQTFPGTPTTVSGSLRTGTLGALTGHGSNLNPLSASDWKIGRTDAGVDANAIPGTPIEAINDSKVVQIVPNWYAGQPLVLMQLTAGPDAGKYWYVSEQIAQTPHVGQRIARGQTVAVYAPHGTGIEIGWGDPNSNSRTAAGASGSANVPGHSNTPEGFNFLHHVLGR